RASLNVGTLNMKGHGYGNPDHPRNKWLHINQLVRNKKLGILAVQETHMTDDYLESIHNCYGRRLHIIHTAHPTRPNAQGVAIVLNKDILPTDNTVSWELIPGRAILVGVQWHKDSMLYVLAIYAPNDPTENAELWPTIHELLLSQHLPLPDLVLGDFNLTEDPADRLPPHSDHPQATLSLGDFCDAIHVRDGWRTTNPTARAYSFSQPGLGSQSRIDRIYLADHMMSTAAEWQIGPTGGVDTDHSLVSVRIADPAIPYVGKGRWTMPLYLLKDKELEHTIAELGVALQKELDTITRLGRTPTRNPQRALATFKHAVATQTRRRARLAIPRTLAKIAALQTDLNRTLLHTATHDDPDLRLTAGLLQQQIQKLERDCYSRARMATKARYILEGETISKYWSLVNKDRKPRDIVYALEHPTARNPTTGCAAIIRKSCDMAEAARNYHDDLQTEGIDPQGSIAARVTKIRNVLAHVTVTASPRMREETAARVNRDDIITALKSAETGKAAGLDGIPYELWTTLYHRSQQDESTGPPPLDIIQALAHAYHDIEVHGVDPSTGFAAGWMCPIYKPNKTNRTLIANYRPITLLNTDYKIFTKALTNKL
ncbi:DNase I-like protein, partial [Trametopsis cervina]